MKPKLVLILVTLTIFVGSSTSRAQEPCYRYLFSFRQDDIITCAAYSPDDRWLATGTEAGTVMISDMQSRKEFVLKNVQSLDNGVQTLRFSQDGKMLVVGGHGEKKGGGQIKVLQTSDYKTLASLDLPGGGVVNFVDLSLDNKRLLSGSKQGARVWDWQEKRITWELKFDDAVSFFDGNRTLLLGFGKTGNLEISPGAEARPIRTTVAAGQVVFFDILEGKVIRSVKTLPEEPVRGLVSAKGGKELFVLTESAVAFRIEVPSGEIKQRIALGDLYRKVNKQRLEVGNSTDFEVLAEKPILVFNDRTNTFFVNYESGKIERLDHQSTVGLRFNRSGREFALLGGVKREELTGIPSQHYWTVNVFSFRPF